MTLFFDTSALIKYYIEEEGSMMVTEWLKKADSVIVSAVCEIECLSVFRRLLSEKRLSREDYELLRDGIKNDFHFFGVVEVADIKDTALGLIEKYQLKSLDSLQLASAVCIRSRIDGFVCADRKLLAAARSEGLGVMNLDFRFLKPEFQS